MLSHTTATMFPAVPACCTLKLDEDGAEQTRGGRQDATSSNIPGPEAGRTMWTASSVACTMYPEG